MRKIAPAVILFVFAMLIWHAFFHPDALSFNIDGDQIDGPLGALLGVMFAGGGLLVGGGVMLFAGVLLAVLFAGVGIVLVAALAIVAALLSPLLLPLLIPLAIICWLAGRARKNRLKAQAP